MRSSSHFIVTHSEYEVLKALPVCVCGETAKAYRAYFYVLQVVARMLPRDVAMKRLGDTCYYVVAYVLSDISAIDHEMDIDRAKLTYLGKRLLNVLDHYAAEGFEKPVKVEAA